MGASPGRHGRRTRLSRSVALAAAAMAGVLTSNLFGHATLGYSAVVIVSLAVGAAAAAAGLWHRNRFEARLALAILATSSLVGQVLVAAVGGPAGGGGHWDLRSVLLVLSSGLVLGLLAADARPALRSPQGEHPYAL